MRTLIPETVHLANELSWRTSRPYDPSAPVTAQPVAAMVRFYEDSARFKGASCAASDYDEQTRRCRCNGHIWRTAETMVVCGLTSGLFVPAGYRYCPHCYVSYKDVPPTLLDAGMDAGSGGTLRPWRFIPYQPATPAQPAQLV